ncbi:TOBE domain-containing protein [Enterovibrio makurazakiensis]|uniref:TOBE domain-containing protein n=1 Tax=Enterovibrio makurazakiensis TaxID=2910232 RepID=UPI003D25156D
MDVTEYLGADIYVVVDCDDLGKVIVRTAVESEVGAGDHLGLQFHANKLHFSDANGHFVLLS